LIQIALLSQATVNMVPTVVLLTQDVQRFVSMMLIEIFDLPKPPQ